MIDEELREELASIPNLLTEVLVNQDILAKQINADVAIQATQAERAVEIARLQKTALKAIRTADWAIVFFNSLTELDGLGEPAGALWLIEQSTWGNQSFVLVIGQRGLS